MKKNLMHFEYDEVLKLDDDKHFEKVTIPITASFIVRGKIKRTLESYCSVMGLEYSIRELKGWLESELVLTVRNGTVKHVKPIALWTQGKCLGELRVHAN